MEKISNQINVKNTSLTEIQPASLMQSYKTWSALPKYYYDLPSWPGIDFLFSIPSTLVSASMILKFAGSIESSKYLFWGSGLTWASGTDMTNKCPLDIKSSDIKQYVEHTLLPTIETKKPHFYETEFMGKAGIRFSENILRLPFINKDGYIDYIATFTLLTNRRSADEYFLTA